MVDEAATVNLKYPNVLDLVIIRVTITLIEFSVKDLTRVRALRKLA